MLLGAVAVAVLAAMGLLAYGVSRPEMGTLYAGLDDAEAGRILTQLQTMKVPAQVGPDGASIQVPADQVARTRMLLAQQGLPSAGGAGYELFDSQGALGLTSFMQRLNRLRATEGELARTIQTLSGVKSARVHLSVPDPEAPGSQQSPPSASVVVRTVTGGLDRAGALSVRHLVAAAVPGLRPGAVTVMDGNGVLLAADGEENGLAALKAEEMRAATEQRLARAVEEMLAPRFGAGNVRVRVAAEIDLGRETLREQTFDPNSRVERSTQTVEEREDSTDRDTERPTTVEQNLPLEDVDATAATARSQRDRAEETTNYELSSKLRERVQDAGGIKRLAVAVVVNGSYAPGPDGQQTYQPRSEAELRQVANLVRTGIGFDEARGDQVTVENLQFIAPPEEGSTAPVLAANENSLPSWLPWAVGAVAASLLAGVLLRPLLQRPVPAEAPAVAAAIGTPIPQIGADGSAMAPAQIAHEGGGQPQTPALPGGAEEPSLEQAMEELIDLRSVEGGVSAAALKKLASIVDLHPEESITVLRGWIYEGGNG